MNALLAQFKMFLIFIIDVVVAFGALFLMLLSRYGAGSWRDQVSAHLVPFSIIILLFILVFYIFNLYSFRFNKNITEFTNSFMKSLVVSFVFSILIFYIFGGLFQLTPKTNLVIFTGIFGIIDFYLRILIKRYLVRKHIDRKIVVVSGETDNLINELRQNQNIGYRIVKETGEIDINEILNLKPDIVVINTIEGRDFNKLYTLITNNVSVYTINNFYEEIFQKVPTEEIDKDTVVDYLSKNRTTFNFIKRIVDVILSLTLILVLVPIFIILAILVKITSRGPALIKQKRISKNGKVFTLYKFRSMVAISEGGQAEKNGAVWTVDHKTDPRITPVGKFIRATHLDEIPQLANILKGDISFVGPRPERPEFVSMLEKNILYYDLRHSVKAGLTGWAQVNYKAGASVVEAEEKLKYDFYYIKNRTVFFDILIILKTIAKIFT